MLLEIIRPSFIMNLECVVCSSCIDEATAQHIIPNIVLVYNSTVAACNLIMK